MTSPSPPGARYGGHVFANSGEAARALADWITHPDTAPEDIELVAAALADAVDACRRRGGVTATAAATSVRRAHLAAALDRARADENMLCHHGTDGGRFIRPDTGQHHCALCRAEHRTEGNRP